MHVREIRAAIPAALAIMVLASGSFLHAQLNRGVITGLVTDPSHAVIGDAKITATHQDTNFASTTVSTATGNYTLPALLIGKYRVQVEAPGFKRAVRDDVELTAGATVRLDVTLEIGAVTESIEVAAKASALETESTRVSTNITNRLVEDLPLVVSGTVRNVMNLAMIAPEAKSANQMRIGGGQGAAWDMIMDGTSLASASSNYQTQRAPISSVPVDAIREFTVESTGMKAEYGRAMGFVSFETKSGTNEFHGNAFEFLRNDALDSRGFFAATTPILKQHDFGGTFGGPVWLPKLYDGKNKTFFFVSFEGFRNRSGDNPSYNTIPLPEMYEGNFNGWVTNTGALIPIYDPATTRLGPDGKSYVRTPFSNNTIPKDRFSQVAKNYLSIRPAEMVPNIPGPRLNYYRAKGSVTEPANKGTARVDHNLTGKDKLYFLYLQGQSDRLPTNNNPPGLPMPFNGYTTHYQTNWSVRTTWDRTITPRVLNSFRFSYQSERGGDITMTSLDPADRWAQKLGIKNTTSEVYGVPEIDRGMPRISMSEYTSWSGAAWGFDRGFDLGFSDDLFIVSGSHSFKTGFFFSRDRWDGGGQHRPNGDFSFSYLATAIPADQSTRTGNAFASFLLGYPGSSGLETPRDVRQIWRHLGGYFQDDWRLSTKLTMNVGLRYEYTFPVVGGGLVFGSNEPSGFSNFDPSVPNPAAGGRLGAMVFSGKGPGRTGKDTIFGDYKAAFSPRLGIAYAMRPGTVIRIYGGRSFSAVKTTGGSTHFDGFILNTTYSSSDLQVNDFPTMLDKGLPPWNKPPFLKPEVSNGLSPGYWQYDDSGRPPEYWTWSFDLQQQAFGNSVLTMRYTGTKGTHLTSNLLRPNQISPAYLKTLGKTLLLANINSAAARAANVPIPWTGFNGTVQEALQPFPQYKSISTSNGGEKTGNSSYHALVLMLDKRYSSGLTFLGSYTLSKMFSNAETASLPGGSTLDHFNRKLEKALSADDQTHVLRFSWSYELPLGKGKPWFASGLSSRLLGGWSIAGIAEYASGTPQMVSPGFSLPFGGGNRVFVTSYDGWRAPVSGEKFDPFKDVWWNKPAFQQVPQAVLDTELGNTTARNPKSRSPWYFNENVSVGKNFPVTERVRMTLRFEAFNLLNRVRWGGPTSTWNSSTFGIVRSQANDPRRMQAGLKFQF